MLCNGECCKKYDWYDFTDKKKYGIQNKNVKFKKESKRDILKGDLKQCVKLQ